MEPVVIGTILTSLVGQFGPTIGRFFGEKINQNESKRQAFKESITSGLAVPEALKKIFGDKYEELMTEAKKVKKIQYESNCNEYISLLIDKELPKDKQNDLLKAELADNLERLQGISSDEHLNKARMIIKQWMKKFVEIKNPDENTIKKLNVLEELLKPGKTNGKDVFKILQKVFKASSVLTLMYTAVLATGAGMGAFVGISYALMGIPMGQVFGGVTLAMILAYLAFLPVNDNTKIQLIINTVYGIIDDGIKPFTDVVKEDQLNAEYENLLKDLEKKLSKKNISEDELILIISLLKHAVLIDNIEHQEEIKVFREFIKDEYILSDEEVDSLYAIAPRIEDIDGFLRELNALLSEEEKKTILSVIKKITVADLKIHKNETELLRVIEKHFNIIQQA